MTRKLGIEDIVGFVPRNERPLDHFREFDIFAKTSWEDPCPLVVLENMALGKPVVCVQGGGGAPEEVESAGLVIPEFRPEMMAAAIAVWPSTTAAASTSGGWLGAESRRCLWFPCKHRNCSTR